MIRGMTRERNALDLERLGGGEATRLSSRRPDHRGWSDVFLSMPRSSRRYAQRLVSLQRVKRTGVDEGRLGCRVDQAASQACDVSRTQLVGSGHCEWVGSNVVHILPKGYQYEGNATCVRLGVTRV